jgi:hypothetical protein
VRAAALDPAAFTSFLEMALRLMARFSSPGSLVLDWRHMAELLAAARANVLEMLNLCIWTKPNAGMGSFCRSQHELVFVFKAEQGAYRSNVQLSRYGRNQTNVWAYAGGPGFGRAGEEGHLAALHPTVKPIAMVADAILDSLRLRENCALTTWPAPEWRKRGNDSFPTSEKSLVAERILP